LKFEKQFQILSVNLTKVIVRHVKPNDLIGNICGFELLKNFADKIAFYTDGDFYRTELTCLNNEQLNISCNYVKEKYNSNWIVWKVNGFGRGEIYKSLQIVFESGVMNEFTRLWDYLQERKNELNNTLSSSSNSNIESLGLVGSNILVAFQLYGICALVCIGSFIGESLMPEIMFQSKYRTVLFKIHSIISIINSLL